MLGGPPGIGCVWRGAGMDPLGPEAAAAAEPGNSACPTSSHSVLKSPELNLLMESSTQMILRVFCMLKKGLEGNWIMVKRDAINFMKYSTFCDQEIIQKGFGNEIERINAQRLQDRK